MPPPSFISFLVSLSLRSRDGKGDSERQSTLPRPHSTEGGESGPAPGALLTSPQPVPGALSISTNQGPARWKDGGVLASCQGAFPLETQVRPCSLIQGPSSLWLCLDGRRSGLEPPTVSLSTCHHPLHYLPLQRQFNLWVSSSLTRSRKEVSRVNCSISINY